MTYLYASFQNISKDLLAKSMDLKNFMQYKYLLMYPKLMPPICLDGHVAWRRLGQAFRA
jgi:hypothetical protein